MLPQVANSSEMGRRGIVVLLLLCSIPQGTRCLPRCAWGVSCSGCLWLLSHFWNGAGGAEAAFTP